MIRASLISSIYNKTTEISITALDNSAAVTLMSTDIERIVQGLMIFHELWANFIQIGLGTWLLQRELGLACLAPVVIAVCTRTHSNLLHYRITDQFIVSATASAFVAQSAGTNQVNWVKAIQKRVGRFYLPSSLGLS